MQKTNGASRRKTAKYKTVCFTIFLRISLHTCYECTSLSFDVNVDIILVVSNYYEYSGTIVKKRSKPLIFLQEDVNSSLPYSIIKLLDLLRFAQTFFNLNLPLAFSNISKLWGSFQRLLYIINVINKLLHLYVRFIMRALVENTLRKHLLISCGFP